MKIKDVNKNLLRDKTCDTCKYGEKAFCGLESVVVLLPEENTCKNWKERDETLKVSWAKAVEVDFSDFNLELEEDIIKSATEEIKKEIDYPSED